MGISMRVYPCPDRQIRRLAEDVGLVEQALRDASESADCYLADFWDALHFLLAGGPEARDLPLACLKVGEVDFRGASDPTHAIFSATAGAFSTEIAGLSEETLRARFDMAKMLEARVYPLRCWLFPDLAEHTFRELITYFKRLRDIAAFASGQGHGLLFSRFEDW